MWPSQVHCISLEISQVILSPKISLFHVSSGRIYWGITKQEGVSCVFMTCIEVKPIATSGNPSLFHKFHQHLPRHSPLSSVVGNLLLLYLLGSVSLSSLYRCEGSHKGGSLHMGHSCPYPYSQDPHMCTCCSAVSASRAMIINALWVGWAAVSGVSKLRPLHRWKQVPFFCALFY